MSHTASVAVGAAIGTPTSVISARPVVLPAPGRGEDLQVRVTAPTTGRDLPIVVFSHGFGSSMDGYAPLAEFWAAHGFVVLHPTHPDSRTPGLSPDDPRTPVIWRFRDEDLARVLDELDVIDGSIPGLAGRLNRDRIAALGHSWGATTAGALIERSLSTLFGAERSMGGITGYSVTETTDENPERVALVQKVTTAYLRSTLGLGDDEWSQARTDLQADPQASGRLDSK